MCKTQKCPKNNFLIKKAPEGLFYDFPIFSIFPTEEGKSQIFIFSPKWRNNENLGKFSPGEKKIIFFKKNFSPGEVFPFFNNRGLCSQANSRQKNSLSRNFGVFWQKKSGQKKSDPNIGEITRALFPL